MKLYFLPIVTIHENPNEVDKAGSSGPIFYKEKWKVSGLKLNILTFNTDNTL